MDIDDSPGEPNVSKANLSPITTPETDKILDEQTRLKYKAISETMGISQLREEQDAIKYTLKILLQKSDEVIQVLNKHDIALKSGTTAGEPSKLQDLEQIGSLVDKFGPVLDRIFPKKETGSSLISQDYIDEHIKKSVMGNFEVGEALIDTLKNKIVGKAMTKAVSEIVTTHEPG